MEQRPWFIHVELVIVLITIIGGFYMIDNKIENHCSMLTARIDQVNSRTDQLYTMFIDLVKEQRKV